MSIAEKLLTIAENEQRVYEAGRQAEWRDFWDKYQNNGNRTLYIYGFVGYGFGSENFYPKYDIKPTGDASKMFYDWQDYDNVDFNLTKRLQDCGVVFDISGATRIPGMFAWGRFTDIPALDVRGCSASNVGYQENLFSQCKKLVTVESITLNENNLFQGWFSNCFELVNIKLIGTIGQNGFDIHWSTKLSKASLLSILNACNIDVTSSPVTITLPSKCIDGATDTETLLSETGDTDLYNAQMSARSLGYNIAFN
jgi:hypothetical protein